MPQTGTHRVCVCVSDSLSVSVCLRAGAPIYNYLHLYWSLCVCLCVRMHISPISILYTSPLQHPSLPPSPSLPLPPSATSPDLWEASLIVLDVVNVMVYCQIKNPPTRPHRVLLCVILTPQSTPNNIHTHTHTRTRTERGTVHHWSQCEVSFLLTRPITPAPGATVVQQFWTLPLSLVGGMNGRDVRAFLRYNVMYVRNVGSDNANQRPSENVLS